MLVVVVIFFLIILYSYYRVYFMCDICYTTVVGSTYWYTVYTRNEVCTISIYCCFVLAAVLCGHMIYDMAFVGDAWSQSCAGYS